MEFSPHNARTPATPPEHDHASSAAISKNPQKKEGTVGELLRFSIIALTLVVLVRFFIATPFIVSGASMEDTFETGEYLIVDQVTYRFNAPEHGDVVIFKFPQNPSKFFIKRIIGTPGDTVTIEKGKVYVRPAGSSEDIELDEPYIHEMRVTDAPLSMRLSEGEYFVMGDNRNASSDSRSWGVLPEENIIGRAFIRLFPLNKITVLPGEYALDAEIISAP